ncbi:hypothetical protein [Streptomyces kronopolitis]|uniref:hypothetical protein n=1 Tax=Streptomyces kronopolitis TaxID=1612435 RepID=UPI003D958765
MAVAGGVPTTAPKRRPVTANDVKKRRLAHALSRSLACEAIPEDLITMVEEVLSDRPGPAGPGGRKLDNLLARMGLPTPRQRSPRTTPLSPEDATRIAERFRRATRLLLQIAPHRIAIYPTDELRRLIVLRDLRPAPDQMLRYLRQYALAIVAVLDLMGDDEE